MANPRWFIVPLTQAHIDAGRIFDCYDCPVALALKEATGDFWSIGHHEAKHYGGPEPGTPWPIWIFPQKISAWIAEFDRKNPVVPMTLRVSWRFVRKQTLES